VDQTEMLRQMCDEVLSEADVKAICKHRGLPGAAASSRSLLESLFVSDTGVAAVLGTLDRTEIALLHLLKAYGKPVDVAFFSRLKPAESARGAYGTFTRRFQGAFSTVKERLVRRGILIQALGGQTWPEKTNMERWQFALPAQFAGHLPPLVESVKRLDGEGDWRSDVAREKLRTVVGQGAAVETGDDKLEIADGELRLGGRPFRAGGLLEWQRQRWLAETAPAKGRSADSPYTLLPAEAAVHILAGLDAGLWGDVDAMVAPLEAFCGFKPDGRLLCESGWRWGCLARQESEGRMWYRLAPRPPAADTPPGKYLAILDDGSVAVDLDGVPLESLENLVMISDQRVAPGRKPVLLVTPNLVKLGRAAGEILALSPADWLRDNSPAFRQAIETLRQRRGKTIVHENLSVARVGDLALKVALEKALGNRVVSLGEDAIAFPREAVADVERIVAKLGHVVKEASHREH
jgi:hypothetical protein